MDSLRTIRMMVIQMPANTDKVWRNYGYTDPFFGVLSNPRYRRGEMNAERCAEFYATGEQDVARVIRQLDLFAPNHETGTVVDFGCGVGRCLMAFASHYRSAIGVDISNGMIAEARRAAEERRLDNVRFEGALDALAPPVDLVHSMHVLQHIDPRHGQPLITRMWELLIPGGVLCIQFPILPMRPLSSKVKEGLKTWLPTLVQAINLLRNGHADPPMQMYCYDLNAVMAGIYASGPAEIRIIRSDPDAEYFGIFLFARKGRSG